MHTRHFVLGAAVALLIGAPHPLHTQGPDVRCRYTLRHVCDSGGCRVAAPSSEYLLVPALASLTGTGPEVVEIRRCDNQGCSPVIALAVASGLYANLGAPDKGYLLKIATSRTPLEAQGTFVEMATLGLSAFLGYGKCE